jgi:hypothetical protein
MAVRTMGVSEARRLLPGIVRTIAEEGGRVDVTLRGRPRVSIVRTADVAAEPRKSRRARLADVLRVEFVVPPGSLVDAVRELRSRIGRPRAAGASEPAKRGRARRSRR